MLKIVRLQFVLLVLLSSIGCNSKKHQGDKPYDDTLNNHVPDMHTSENALDWEGSYQGVLPCADCEGIKTTINLNKNLSYTVKDEYLGKKDGVVESNGTFQWSDDGQRIFLSDFDKHAYFVGENRLIQLDKSGNKITGDLADFYVLNRIYVPQVSFADTKWQLVEIMGNQVRDSEAFISFASENNKVFGNNSCNSFNGNYEMKNGHQIAFSQVATTMMACLEVALETQFMDMLKKVDNYALNGNIMTLNNAEMAPLAVFEAID